MRWTNDDHIHIEPRESAAYLVIVLYALFIGMLLGGLIVTRCGAQLAAMGF